MRLLILFAVCLLSSPSWASDDDSDSDSDCRTDCGGDSGGDGGDGGDGGMGGSAAIVGLNFLSGSSSTGEGVATASITNAQRAPNIYLNPANQVESCGRTFGISGSNTSGGWALGLPIPRSWTPTCDLWKASNEAQENGHIYTSYMFQCSIKALRKVWGDDRCGEFEDRVAMELGLDVDRRWLMAEVSEEEYYEQQEQAEERYQEQQQQIEALQEERDEEQAELEKLRARTYSNRAEQRSLAASENEEAAKIAAKKERLKEILERREAADK